MKSMKLCFTAALALLLLFGSLAGAAEKPDVLFIAIDDLNDWTGCLGGHPQASTPNLDRLVSRGTLFTNAQCAAPACNPSRAALMSGLRPFTTGVYLNSQPYGQPLANVLTLNRYLIQQGYEVLGGGKIYHGAGGLPKEHETDWIPGHDQVPGRTDRAAHGCGGSLRAGRRPGDRALV